MSNGNYPILFIADENGFYRWFDGIDAIALVPANAAGRAWIGEAERIMAEPIDPEDDEAQQAAAYAWDDHSIALESIGGRWL
jgi:hypothetical protein